MNNVNNNSLVKESNFFNKLGCSSQPGLSLKDRRKFDKDPNKGIYKFVSLW